jgi:HAD superfamily hydrolase (TIGR01484 family)
VKTPVKCLVVDYDGTISPLNVPRDRSRVPKKTSETLKGISKFIPIAIVTTKDLRFVMAKTPFAQAWSCVFGLETKVSNKVRRKGVSRRGLNHISLALKYANSQVTNSETEVEEKKDDLGRLVAFCIDWRRAKNVVACVKAAANIAAYCEQLGLKVIRYEGQPFLDVYPVALDKGAALTELLRKMNVKQGVLYMGDSEGDNPAFERSTISVGVIHEENSRKRLMCDYFVRFDDVSSFLRCLLENDLAFEPIFPMVEVNAERLNQKCSKE